MTPAVLNRIAEQFCNSSVLKRDRESLQTLVIHLICRSGSGAFNLLLFLLDTASGGQGSPEVKEGSKVNKMVQDTCALVLVSEINYGDGDGDDDDDDDDCYCMFLFITLFHIEIQYLSQTNMHSSLDIPYWMSHTWQTKFATFSSLVTMRKKEWRHVLWSC